MIAPCDWRCETGQTILAGNHGIFIEISTGLLEGQIALAGYLSIYRLKVQLSGWRDDLARCAAARPRCCRKTQSGDAHLLCARSVHPHSTPARRATGITEGEAE